ncbi:ABC transporter permease [Gracilibacillus thailandensis]|jgi:lantibiotic transport system permease protein|uniref:ABC transporter permease subunit n=1 Tax=Gracilibacillus thailandensis TaxID=563735 RepID=A0A6N7R4M9_9BACI|nr:ABC transporter permease [Gracilibacillus thailandensis]MRI68165.1 ABC transporter permease subunit [Gracilibacillus thailandensis]
MLAILHSEWFKLRKSKVTLILFVGPLIGLFIGLTGNSLNVGEQMNQWYAPLFMMNFTYAILFLPLITGVLASVICRYEHQEGGWKQLLALPVTRGKVFLTKYLLLILLVLFMQILYLGAIYAVGTIEGFTDPFPLTIVWKSIIGGWVATMPLVALQLWLSILFKSFAAPFAVNVIFTLPTILVVNSERFGPYYPWAQPFSMMYVGGNTDDVFFIPWDQLLTVVGGGFLVFFLCGYIYFQRKPI